MIVCIQRLCRKCCHLELRLTTVKSALYRKFKCPNRAEKSSHKKKQPSCIKRMKKSCEIKGGGHEMATMMLMTINFIILS